MEMFSRRRNLEWQAGNVANTPLALHHGVDFELVHAMSQLDEPYLTRYRSGELGTAQLQELERSLNNVVLQIEMIWKSSSRRAAIRRAAPRSGRRSAARRRSPGR